MLGTFRKFCSASSASAYDDAEADIPCATFHNIRYALRRAGINLNPIMRHDPDVEQMALMDLTGGSIVFYNTRARLEKDTGHA
jgi:hypothetical protein